MSRRDTYHDHVREALLTAGWMLVKESFTLDFAATRVRMDLLVEKVEEDGSKTRVVIEVKNFVDETVYVSELQRAIGQYLIYRDVLEKQGHNYPLYLAVPVKAYQSFFIDSLTHALFQRHQIQLLLFNPSDSSLLLWNP